MSRVGPEQATTPSRPAAHIEHVQISRRSTEFGKHRRRDQFGRPIIKPLELLIKILSELVERAFHELIRRPRRHALSRGGGEHVARHRILGIVLHPLPPDSGGIVGPAQHRQRGG